MPLFNGFALILAVAISVISGRHRRSAAPAGTTQDDAASTQTVEEFVCTRV